MSDRKLPLLAKQNTLAPQPDQGAFGQASCSQASCGQADFGPASCAGGTGSPASAEENLRLLKAFSRVGDAPRRAWLLELVEYFAGLESATR